MIDHVEPVPDRAPLVEPVTRPRLLTPVEREQERRRREEQRRRRAPRPRPDGAGEASADPPPRLDVRG